MTTKKQSLEGLEVQSSKKIGNNTYQWIDNRGIRRVRLHMTDIITYNPNGSMTLNSGGWRTVTTKSRINEFLPKNISLYQKDFEWYIKTPIITYKFVDGITINTFNFNLEGTHGEVTLSTIKGGN